MNHFPDVTLLITHYNRSSSLARLLKTFQDQGFRFGEIVVSDDCSKVPHLEEVKKLQREYAFKLLTTAVNKGLGNNINKGQKEVKTPYTLYVQEDFIPTPQFAHGFKEAFGMMNQEESLDLVRFYAYYAHPYMKPYKGKFMEALYKPWFLKTEKIYCYSDHPHLRRSNFAEKFGPYKEGIKSDKTEYLMCVSFIKGKGRALFYQDYKSLFIQSNSTEEPSTVKRSEWRQSNNALIAAIRFIYRVLKYNFEIHVAPLPR